MFGFMGAGFSYKSCSPHFDLSRISVCMLCVFGSGHGSISFPSQWLTKVNLPPMIGSGTWSLTCRVLMGISTRFGNLRPCFVCNRPDTEAILMDTLTSHATVTNKIYDKTSDGHLWKNLGLQCLRKISLTALQLPLVSLKILFSIHHSTVIVTTSSTIKCYWWLIEHKYLGTISTTLVVLIGQLDIHKDENLLAFS